MKHVEVVIDNPKVHDSEIVARSTAQQRAVTPWKDRLRPWVLSIHLQSALQIAAGTFVACLFTFIRPIAFPQSCVIATLFLVVSVMMSPNNHLGTRINAAASLLGSLWIGAVVAGVVATLAKIPGPGATSTAIYIILGAVTIAVLSINRVGTTPPTLWSLGMVNCLAFGLVALSSWKLHSIQQVWMVTGFIVLAAVVAAVIGTLTAALVMPTLASEKVQELLADVLQSAGTATSRYSARLFRPQPPAHTQPQQQYPQQASKDVQDVTGSDRPGAAGAATGVDQSMSDGEVTLSAGAAALEKAGSIYSLGDAGAAFVLDDPMTDEQWLELIRLNSSPNPSARPKAYVCPMPQATVGLLRPKLAEVQNMLLPAAAVEPPWLRGLCGPNGHWFDAAAWGRVVQAVQVLIIRLSALEAIAEDGESLHEYSWLSSPELLARLRLVYSQTATSLALMAHTVKTYGSPTTAAVAAAGSAADGPFCVMVGAFGASWREAKTELTAFMQQHFESHWKRMASAPPGSPVTLPSLTNVRHLMFGWVLTNSIVTSIEQLETTLAAAVCNAPPPSLLTRLFSWLTPLWPLLCGKHLFVNWHRVLAVDLPAAVKQGSAGVNKVCAQPLFQAGLKYWLVLVLVYTATLLAMHFDTAIASLTPAFGYVAAVLTMSERVEATVSKVSFWVAGTIAGGALGFLAMLHPLLATNPYALAAIMAVAAFLVGLLGQTRARVMITLTLMTLSALVLCQYNAVSAGRGEVAAARVVSVIAGVLTAVVVCNIVMPWYTSNWAIQTMCQAYEHSIQLLCELLAKSYQVGAEAAASHHTNAATTTLHPGQPSAAAAAQLSAALAAAAADAFPDAMDCATARDPGSSAALQAEIARPLVAVQVSLMRDTVAWRRGVLATPPIVPQLLSSLQALLDRLAALQLALNPPKVTGVITGRHVLWFGVPMKDNLVYLMELHGLLAAAVAAAVMHPESKTHTNAVKILVKSIEHHRTNMFKQMMHLRKELHIHALQQQQLTAATVACAAATTSADKPQQQQQRHSDESPACVDMRQQIVEYFGTADDAVAYLGFQFALLKALDKTAAVAKVVLQDSCKARNSTRCTMV